MCESVYGGVVIDVLACMIACMHVCVCFRACAEEADVKAAGQDGWAGAGVDAIALPDVGAATDGAAHIAPAAHAQATAAPGAMLSSFIFDDGEGEEAATTDALISAAAPADNTAAPPTVTPPITVPAVHVRATIASSSARQQQEQQPPAQTHTLDPVPPVETPETPCSSVPEAHAWQVRVARV